MSNSGDAPPPFENPFDTAASAEERVYNTVIQTREPTTAKDMADAADCDPKTARKYLEWFSRLGVVREHDGEPPTYERNDRYFEWRRINELASKPAAELQSQVQSLAERIETYEQRYDADDPGEVDALAPPEDIATETAFAELTDWQTARTELQRHEQARRLQAGDSSSPVRQ
jgi:predicted transcriptional regulator